VTSVPGTGRRALTVFWKGRDGHLWVIRRKPGSRCAHPANLGMGKLGGAPAATGLASGEVDVFWSAKSHASVWQLSFFPGRGWGKADDLTAGVSAGRGRRTGHRCRCVLEGKQRHIVVGGWPRRQLGPARPARDGGAGQRAVRRRQPGGVVNVFWKGSADRHLWQARYRRGAWSRPADLGGAVS
jgi:hypothetical protein